MHVRTHSVARPQTDDRLGTTARLNSTGGVRGLTLGGKSTHSSSLWATQPLSVGSDSIGKCASRPRWGVMHASLLFVYVVSRGQPLTPRKTTVCPDALTATARCHSDISVACPPPPRTLLAVAIGLAGSL